MNKIIVLPIIKTRVVGTAFDNRQTVVAFLTQWEQVFLVREPENGFDRNAVKCIRWDKQHFGYINRELAKILAPRMDCNRKRVRATVIAITGDDYPGSRLGVWIKFRLPEE